MVKELGIERNGFYVYGSSWGTCLAQEYAVLRPDGLRGLILDGALCDGQLVSRRVRNPPIPGGTEIHHLPTVYQDAVARRALPAADSHAASK